MFSSSQFEKKSPPVGSWNCLFWCLSDEFQGKVWTTQLQWMDKKYVLNKPWPPWEITYQLVWLMVRSKGPPSTKHHWTCSEAQMGSKWPWLSTWGRLRTSKHTSKSNVFQRFGKHFFWKKMTRICRFQQLQREQTCSRMLKKSPQKKTEDQLLFLRSLSCCSFRTLKPCESVQTHLSGDLYIESLPGVRVHLLTENGPK